MSRWPIRPLGLVDVDMTSTRELVPAAPAAPTAKPRRHRRKPALLAAERRHRPSQAKARISVTCRQPDADAVLTELHAMAGRYRGLCVIA